MRGVFAANKSRGSRGERAHQLGLRLSAGGRTWEKRASPGTHPAFMRARELVALAVLRNSPQGRSSRILVGSAEAGSCRGIRSGAAGQCGEAYRSEVRGIGEGRSGGTA